MITIDYNLLRIAFGAGLSAFAYALTTYLSKTNEEDWDFVKAGKTVILAAFVAIVGTYFNITTDILTSSPFYAFLGIVLERILKFIHDKIVPKLKSRYYGLSK